VCYNLVMLISSVQTNTFRLSEPQGHPSGCECPGCCRAGSTSGESLQEQKPQLEKNTKEDGLNHVTTQKSEILSSTEQSKLSQSEQQQVMQLQQRDSEVRSHEAAHMAAGGSAVSGSASFTYQKGPDGKLYAVGGEVPISASGGNTPQEKIAIAQQVQAGALAPASPSPQDLKVAASAAVMEARARQELSQEKLEERKETAINTYKENQGYL